MEQYSQFQMVPALTNLEARVEESSQSTEGHLDNVHYTSGHQIYVANSFRPNHIIFKPPGSEEMMREVVMKVESMQEKLYEFEVISIIIIILITIMVTMII